MLGENVFGNIVNVIGFFIILCFIPSLFILFFFFHMLPNEPRLFILRAPHAYAMRVASLNVVKPISLCPVVCRRSVGNKYIIHSIIVFFVVLNLENIGTIYYNIIYGTNFILLWACRLVLKCH